MIANPSFQDLPKHFWANVRTISQRLGYTARGTGQILVPSIRQIGDALRGMGLATAHLMNERGQPTEFGKRLVSYFKHRAQVLNRSVEPRLMDVVAARALFEDLQKTIPTKRMAPMNK